MKKKLFTALVLIFSTSIFAQVEITPTFGYTISGKVETLTGYLNVQNDISYGGIIGVEVSDYSFIEFSYRRSTPTIIEESFNGSQEVDRYEAGIEHYQLGFLREFEIDNDEVLPFVNFTLGASRYFSRESNINVDNWLFSWTFGGGIKYFFTDNIGLRLQTNLVLPSAWGGNSLWCGWGGCYTYSSYYIPLVHWDNSLGLIFRID